MLKKKKEKKTISKKEKKFQKYCFPLWVEEIRAGKNFDTYVYTSICKIISVLYLTIIKLCFAKEKFFWRQIIAG